MGSKHIYWNNEHVNIIRITISIRINNGCILSIQRKRSNILASILVFYAKKKNCHKICRCNFDTS